MARIKRLAAKGHSLPEIKNELAKDIRKKILVVESEPETGDLIVNAPGARRPLEVKVARDGFAAGRMLADFAPDLVVLDLGLPGVDAVEICRQIRSDENLGGTRVLAVSGPGAEAMPSKALDAGADRWIAKPIAEKDLLNAVGDLLGLRWEEVPQRA
jgi:DNA-binding response OmpR family regulator